MKYIRIQYPTLIIKNYNDKVLDHMLVSSEQGILAGGESQVATCSKLWGTCFWLSHLGMIGILPSGVMEYHSTVYLPSEMCVQAWEAGFIPSLLRFFYTEIPQSDLYIIGPKSPL